MAGNQIIDRRVVAIPGPTGRAAKITGASATSVPADQAASVSMSGPDTDRQFAFDIPRGLPGVNAVPADEAVAAYVAAPGTATMGALRRWWVAEGAHAVFIGDSITQGYQASDSAHRWTTLLSQRFGWGEHNYGVGGSGYTKVGQSPSGRFDMQIQAAADSTAYDHASVGFVFMLGGVNDGAVSGGDLTTAKSRAASSVATLRAAFPNARIITGMGYSGWLDPAQHSLGTTGFLTRIPYYRAMESALAQAGAEVIPDMWRWLAFNPDWFDVDSVHPNDAGYARIADLLAQVVTGTYDTPSVMTVTAATAGLTFGPDVTANTVTYDVVGDMLHVQGTVTLTIPSSASTGTTDFNARLFYFPPFFRVASWRALGPATISYQNSPWAAANYLQISTEAGKTFTRINLRKASGNIAVGDVIVVYTSFTLPAYGVL